MAPLAVALKTRDQQKLNQKNGPKGVFKLYSSIYDEELFVTPKAGGARGDEAFAKGFAMMQ